MIYVQPKDFFTIRQLAGEFARTAAGFNTPGR